MPAFQIKIYKAFGGRTSNLQWSNSYFWDADGTVEESYWTDVVDALGVYEASFHSPQVNFMRAVVSTFTEEQVYNPLNLRVFELNAVGARNVPAGEQLLDLNLALKMKKLVGFGRAGTAFYRGCLNTGDVEVGAGGVAVLTQGGVDSLNISHMQVWTSKIVPAMTLSGGNLVMNPGKLLDAGQPAAVRLIHGFRASGVSVNRRDHKYFDKAESDDGVGPGT